MTFQAISRAQNLHTPRYMAGKQFHNDHGDQEYSFFDTKAEAEKYKTDYLNDPKNKVGGARNIPRDIPEGFVTGEEMLILMLVLILNLILNLI